MYGQFDLKMIAKFLKEREKLSNFHELGILGIKLHDGLK
jgi:hypothetical protein